MSTEFLGIALVSIIFLFGSPAILITLCGVRRGRKRPVENLQLKNVRKISDSLVSDTPPRILNDVERKVLLSMLNSKRDRIKSPTTYELAASTVRLPTANFQRSSAISVENSLYIPAHLDIIMEESSIDDPDKLIEGENVAPLIPTKYVSSSESFSWIPSNEIKCLSEKKKMLIRKYKQQKAAGVINYGSSSSSDGWSSPSSVSTTFSPCKYLTINMLKEVDDEIQAALRTIEKLKIALFVVSGLLVLAVIAQVVVKIVVETKAMKIMERGPVRDKSIPLPDNRAVARGRVKEEHAIAKKECSNKQV
ncbi:hypothetical protein DdX_07979 [Ditylenchus destructor]|uniref:Uncharacterized protein n=1 Tax=Ditylenchus destructor TaxID=166010 RepID=A0AAD4N525_9BILA|nr:hypothetical protein DdX_07979 [Ditylenchus destructor]